MKMHQLSVVVLLQFSLLICSRISLFFQFYGTSNPHDGAYHRIRKLPLSGFPKWSTSDIHTFSFLYLNLHLFSIQSHHNIYHSSTRSIHRSHRFARRLRPKSQRIHQPKRAVHTQHYDQHIPDPSYNPPNIQDHNDSREMEILIQLMQRAEPSIHTHFLG